MDEKKRVVRATLWTAPNNAYSPQSHHPMRVLTYVVEDGARGHVPDTKRGGEPASVDLNSWMECGWRFAPLSYYCNQSNVTVVVLERVVDVQCR